MLMACSRAPQEAWVARVNGYPITVRSLQTLLQKEKTNYGTDLWQSPEGFTAIKRQVLQTLIEQRVLIQEAQRQNVAIDPDLFERKVQQLRSGVSEAEFRELLKKEGMTFSEWMVAQKEKLLVEQLLHKNIYAQINIKAEQIQAYYRERRNQFTQAEQAHCRHIVTNKQEKAERILALLKKGQPFAQVANEFSEGPERKKGGDLGWIAKDQYPKVFHTCFALKPGMISPIVSSEYGFHIFQNVAHRASHALDLPEATPEIRQILTAQEAEKRLQSWLNGVFGGAKIEIQEDVLKRITAS